MRLACRPSEPPLPTLFVVVPRRWRGRGDQLFAWRKCVLQLGHLRRPMTERAAALPTTCCNSAISESAYERDGQRVAETASPLAVRNLWLDTNGAHIDGRVGLFHLATPLLMMLRVDWRRRVLLPVISAPLAPRVLPIRPAPR